MADENLYWLFSSSAQAISAFFALLLAGFTLVLTMMDLAQQRDETLEEIHTRLIRNYYREIKLIAVVTAVAILGSLAMVYLNAYAFPFKTELEVVIAVFDVLSVVWGMRFVMSIIDPDKYQKAANQLFEQEESKSEARGEKVDPTGFVEEFDALESDVRQFIDDQDFNRMRRRLSDRQVPFRQLIALLTFNRVIDRPLRDSLMRVSALRNFIIHGSGRQVDEDMVVELHQAADRLRTALTQYTGSGRRRARE